MGSKEHRPAGRETGFDIPGTNKIILSSCRANNLSARKAGLSATLLCSSAISLACRSEIIFRLNPVPAKTISPMVRSPNAANNEKVRIRLLPAACSRNILSLLFPGSRLFRLNERGANSKFMPLLRNREVPSRKHETRSRAHAGRISTHLASLTKNSRFSVEAVLRINALNFQRK